MAVRWARRLLLASAGAAAAILAANVWVIRRAGPFLHERVADVPSRPVALVLGARVFTDGGLSAMLADRAATALELYSTGKVGKLLVSGDHGRREYDEVDAVRRYMVANGVAPEDLFLDHAGFDTYDSMYRARDVFGVRGVIVVTQRFHLARAIYTARGLGLDAVGVVADRRDYRAGARTRSGVREAASRTKAFLEVALIHPRPRFLGPRISIDGDGRRTQEERGGKRTQRRGLVAAPPGNALRTSRV